MTKYLLILFVLVSCKAKQSPDQTTYRINPDDVELRLEILSAEYQTGTWVMQAKVIEQGKAGFGYAHRVYPDQEISLHYFKKLSLGELRCIATHVETMEGNYFICQNIHSDDNK